MPSRLPTPVWLTLAVGILACAIHQTSLRLEVETRSSKAAGTVGPLPNGRVLRVASLGFERVLADLFWIRTVYYMGDEHSHAAGWPAAEDLAQLVTDIDPYFSTVYVVMGSGLEGLAHDAAASRRLLEKGARHVDYWKIHFLLGFNYFFRKPCDTSRAATHMERASELPGGPPYLALLASRLHAASGDHALARDMVRRRLENATTDQEREDLEIRYRDLWINEHLERIDAAIARYREEHGSVPANVAALVRAGFLDEEPRDPRGDAYPIGEDGRADCRVPYERMELKGSLACLR